MKLYTHLTREVDMSRGGKTTTALFDFDGTLIAGYSIATFLKHRILSGRMPPREAIEQLFAICNYGLRQIDFEELMAQAALSLRGVSDDSLREFAAEIFENDLSADIYPESRALVSAHLAKGHTVVLVSSATQYQVENVATELGIEHVVCTRLEVEDGILTGQIVPPAAYGSGKLEAARRFADSAGIDLEKAYFYTDGAEDMPLLKAVGFPRPINPDSELQARADREGWPSRTFTSRGLPGIVDVARTGLVYGSFVSSYIAALPAWFLNNSRREFTNIATSIWSEVGGAVAGLNIRTSGEEHLWSHRPAVFIFNHQSGLELVLLLKLLRRDFTGIAKQELRHNPIFGPLFTAAGAVFVDRSNTAKAIEALGPAVEALRHGRSLIIAPEGTRSTTAEVGRFKKGAFRLAMDAGVPIVPVVFRNVLDALPKGAVIVRPAVVEAVVLPPIDTSSWTLDTLEEEIRTVRNHYVAILDDSQS